MHTVIQTLLQQGNEALQKGNPQQAIGHYLEAALHPGGNTVPLVATLEGNLESARSHHLHQRREARLRGEPAKVAVCGWELSHHPAGRVLTLADAYRRVVPEVEIIGSIFPRWGRSLWAPIRGADIPCHTLLVEEEANFITQALQLVAKHPYDHVHLSKPRFPNLVFGLLYELVWGAKVVWDIDDEELGFVGETEPLSFPHALDEHGQLPPLERLHDAFWTRLTVGQVSRFAGVTVSNPALQARYGGEMIPHVRDETRFVPSQERRAHARQRWGIPDHVKVVLFFGTPHKHMGLLETAQAMASLGRHDLWFVIVGDFADESLKEQLLAVRGVRYRFIGDQPHRSIPDIVAMGDYTVLLQDTESPAAQYQLPEELVDALAMGLVVFAQVTPATEWLEDAGVIFPVTCETLAATLDGVLGAIDDTALREYSHTVFLQQLSLGSCEEVFAWLLEPSNAGGLPSWNGRLISLAAGEARGLQIG